MKPFAHAPFRPAPNMRDHAFQAKTLAGRPVRGTVEAGPDVTPENVLDDLRETGMRSVMPVSKERPSAMEKSFLAFAAIATVCAVIVFMSSLTKEFGPLGALIPVGAFLASWAFNRTCPPRQSR